MSNVAYAHPIGGLNNRGGFFVERPANDRTKTMLQKLFSFSTSR